MKKISLLLSAAIMLSSMAALTSYAEGTGNVTVSSAVVNHLETPMGIDTMPVFGWKNNAEGTNKAQSAYRIIVSSTAENANSATGDMWDSGKVASGNNFDVKYEGKDLSSKTEYFWRVKVWDENDTESDWSEVYTYETGILNQNEWQGKWISAPDVPEDEKIDFSGCEWILLKGENEFKSIPAGTQYFRKTFKSQDKLIKSAWLIFSGDDNSQMYLNRTKLATSSKWNTDAVAIDLTGAVTRNSDNLLAFSVNNTTEGYTGLIAKLRIVYADGTEQIVKTSNDQTWKVTNDLSSTKGDWFQANTDVAAWGYVDHSVVYGEAPWSTGITLPEFKWNSSPVFRYNFQIPNENKDKVKKARAYVAGLGLYELKINNKSADDSVLNPANTNYNKTVPYRVYDITSHVQGNGNNAVAVELGNGFYNESYNTSWKWNQATWKSKPKLKINIDVEFEDGTKITTVSTNENWKVYTNGPTTFNSILFGEDYNGAFELPLYGSANIPWTDKNYAPFTYWRNAADAESTKPAGELKFENMPPMRKSAAIEPISATYKNGRTIIEAPYMMTGWASVTLGGAINKKQEYTITYCEKLDSNGNPVKPWIIAGKDVRQSQMDKIITNTNKDTFEPKFSYKGFKYVVVENYYNEELSKNYKTSVQLYQINTETKTAGSFTSSNELLNTLHDMQVRTLLNNFQGKPTDTPVFEKRRLTELCLTCRFNANPS